MDKKMKRRGNEDDVAHRTDERGEIDAYQSNYYYGYAAQPLPQSMPPVAYEYNQHYDAQWMAHGNMYPPHMYQQHESVYQQYPYPLQHMDGVPLPPGIPGLGGSTDPLEAILGPFPCVHLRNLPYDASVEEILLLFQGLSVIDVVVVGSGEAFVIFSNPMDFHMGLQRNRQSINRRFVDISTSSRDEYYEAVATIHEQERGIKLGSGLDLRVGDGLRHIEGGRHDIKHSGGDGASLALLWGQTASSPPSMHSVSPQPGFVDTNMLLHSTAALSIGGRSSGSGSGQGRNVLQASVQKRAGGGIQVGEHTGYLRMRGLPFSATKDDIYKFFAVYNPILESIVLTYRNDSRATGEAYIGFETAEDAKCAMELHRRSMGSRYIELFISNKEEHGRALTRFGGR